MKAPSSAENEEDDTTDASKDEGADDKSVLDYEDFFSVLMYYGHMSYDDIMNRSRLFLYGIYKRYGRRACENLGVSPDKKDDENVSPDTLTDSDYPSEFKRFTPQERKKAAEEFKDTADFMRQFGGFSASSIQDSHISVDKH